MDIELDSSKILYVVGALLGIATIIYFSAEIIVELSPTLKSGILLLGFVFFFTTAQYTHDTLLDLVMYVLSAGSYIVFLAYTIIRFNLSENEVFLLLGASTILFVGLGYALHEKEFRLKRKHARIGMVALVLLTVVGVGFDFLGSQPTVETEFRSDISIEGIDSAENRVTLGEVTVQNSFVLSRTAELPNYHACVLPTNEIQTLSYRAQDDMAVSRNMLLSGGEERSFDITMQSVVFYNRSISGPEIHDAYMNVSSIPIEQSGECPAPSTVSQDDVRIVIVEDFTRTRFD